MAATEQNIVMHAGDTKHITVTVVDGNGDPVALAGATVAWSMAPSVHGPALLAKSTAGGTITIDGSTFSFTLEAADTAGLPARPYYHEAAITDSGGDTATVMTGEIEIEKDLV